MPAPLAPDADQPGLGKNRHVPGRRGRRHFQQINDLAQAELSVGKSRQSLQAIRIAEGPGNQHELVDSRCHHFDNQRSGE